MKWRPKATPPQPNLAIEERVGPHTVRVYATSYDDVRTFYSAREVLTIGGKETWAHLATADTAEKALSLAAARLGYEPDE